MSEWVDRRQFSQAGKNTPARAAEMTGHTAPGQTAGYVYQCRYALLAALREPDPGPQLAISIEQLDDVAFEEQGDPLARLQTKHHVNAVLPHGGMLPEAAGCDL
jgi:hypothetical protein